MGASQHPLWKLSRLGYCLVEGTRGGPDRLDKAAPAPKGCHEELSYPRIKLNQVQQECAARMSRRILRCPYSKWNKDFRKARPQACRHLPTSFPKSTALSLTFSHSWGVHLTLAFMCLLSWLLSFCAHMSVCLTIGEICRGQNNQGTKDCMQLLAKRTTALAMCCFIEKNLWYITPSTTTKYFRPVQPLQRQ